jgi:hypothetical protein
LLLLLDDIDPLKILVVDMRSLRDEKFNDLVSPEMAAEIAKWEATLVEDRVANKPDPRALLAIRVSKGKARKGAARGRRSAR